MASNLSSDDRRELEALKEAVDLLTQRVEALEGAKSGKAAKSVDLPSSVTDATSDAESTSA